jgi:hypothetical protein
MQNNDSTQERHVGRVISEKVLENCRDHIQSLQNLSYLTSLDTSHPQQVMRNVRMMEGYLRSLSKALFLPL